VGEEQIALLQGQQSDFLLSHRERDAAVRRFNKHDAGEESRRITVQEVAEATGVNRMTLSKILNHKGYSTGTDILDRLCTYFGCRIEELVEYVPD